MPFAVPPRINRRAAKRKTFKTFNSFFLSDRLNVCNRHTEFFQLLLQKTCYAHQTEENSMFFKVFPARTCSFCDDPID